MPKINPRAVPIITWLRKCFIRNTLERPTKIDIKTKIEVINRFLSIKKNKLVNKKNSKHDLKACQFSGLHKGFLKYLYQ